MFSVGLIILHFRRSTFLSPLPPELQVSPNWPVETGTVPSPTRVWVLFPLALKMVLFPIWVVSSHVCAGPFCAEYPRGNPLGICFVVFTCLCFLPNPMFFELSLPQSP